MKELNRTPERSEGKASVYCYMCTHTVEADVVNLGRTTRVKPGQKCPRCSGSLDSGYVIRMSQAA
jgi:hypothetical protein